MRTLKEKEILHNYTHKEGGITTDTRIINLEIHTDTPGLNTIKKKFKFTYECYNADECFTGELFDGNQLNPVFIITDLGITRDRSAYHIPTEFQLKARIEMLTIKGIEFIKSLY